MTIELEIKGEPEPWTAPRIFNRTRVYDPRYNYKKTSRMQIRAQYKGKPIEEACIIWFYFFLPIPKSKSEKKIKEILKHRFAHTVKPDVDNLTKCAMDILKKTVIVDDNLVTAIHAMKEYSDDPRTIIIVQQRSELIPKVENEMV